MAKKFKFGTGALPDPRTQDEKDKDYKVQEVYMAVPVMWTEKPKSEWRSFEIFNQDGSGSCVLQTCAKVLGVENYLEDGKFVRYSARDGYSQRINKPGQGMWLQNGLEICYKRGLTLEQLMPSEGKNETDMNLDEDRKSIDIAFALDGKASAYVQAETTIIDFDTIAGVLQTGKAVALTATFNSGDWNTGEVICKKNGTYGHAITITDFTLYKGEKALIFDNSWGEGWGFDGQGILRESQKDGITSWGYLLELKNDWQNAPERPKPIHFFAYDLKYGTRSDENGFLQLCLQYEQVFPYNIPSTGYFGGITARAVIDFCKKYLPNKITNGKLVDLEIRTELNKRYNQ